MVFAYGRSVFHDGYLSSTGMVYGSLKPLASVSFTNPFPVTPINQFTIGLWVKRLVCVNTQSLLLSCKSAFELTTTTALTASIFDIGISSAVGSKGSACINEWTQIVVTFKSRIIQLYLNGLKDGTSGLTQDASKVMGSSNEWCYLGNNKTVYGVLNGVTGYVRHLYIISVGLNEEEVLGQVHVYHKWTPETLFYSEIDESLNDKYKHGISMASSGDFSFVKTNEPEFSCYCTG